MPNFKTWKKSKNLSRIPFKTLGCASVCLLRALTILITLLQEIVTSKRLGKSYMVLKQNLLRP
jgi:hypothetical protein